MARQAKYSRGPAHFRGAGAQNAGGDVLQNLEWFGPQEAKTNEGLSDIERAGKQTAAQNRKQWPLRPWA
jgi:hypothetical protein